MTDWNKELERDRVMAEPKKCMVTNIADIEFNNKLNALRAGEQTILIINDKVDSLILEKRKPGKLFDDFNEYHNTTFKRLLINDNDGTEIGVEYCVFPDDIVVYIYAENYFRRLRVREFIETLLDFSNPKRPTLQAELLTTEEFNKWIKNDPSRHRLPESTSRNH